MLSPLSRSDCNGGDRIKLPVDHNTRATLPTRNQM